MMGEDVEMARNQEEGVEMKMNQEEGVEMTINQEQIKTKLIVKAVGDKTIVMAMDIRQSNPEIMTVTVVAMQKKIRN